MAARTPPRAESGTAPATELVASLRGENAGLRAEVRDLEAEKTALSSRIETLQVQIEKLQATGAVLSRSKFGRKSERQKKPRSGRKRGQQRGAPGHGRTRRPRLKERAEKRNPPKDARVCPRCGKPYVANGERCTALVEIEVKAHKHTVVRPRWLRACECASSPKEVMAPPVARLFDNTPYGVSVWVCVLFERFVSCRPLHRVAAWLAAMGLAIAPGTLADSINLIFNSGPCDALRQHLSPSVGAWRNLAGDDQHGDDSPVPYIMVSRPGTCGSSGYHLLIVDVSRLPSAAPYIRTTESREPKRYLLKHGEPGRIP